MSTIVGLRPVALFFASYVCLLNKKLKNVSYMLLTMVFGYSNSLHCLHNLYSNVFWYLVRTGPKGKNPVGNYNSCTRQDIESASYRSNRVGVAPSGFSSWRISVNDC